jgi:hypothetical protein
VVFGQLSNKIYYPEDDLKYGPKHIATIK